MALTIFCPACKLAPLDSWFIKRNKHGLFPICRCRSCHSAFVWPRPDEEKTESFYRDSSYKNLTSEEVKRDRLIYYPTADMDASRLIDRCRRLARGRFLLDIGAGFGEFSMAAKRSGLDVVACEPNPSSRRIFVELNHFEPETGMFDRDLARAYKDRFDIALLSHVLEHANDPEAFVDNLRLVLKDGGIAAVAVPHFGSALSRVQGKRDMFICPPEHLNFFSAIGLVHLFERSGFRILYLETVSKLNRLKIRRIVRSPLLSEWAWRGLYRVLNIADSIGWGMVLNAYFGKQLSFPGSGGSDDSSCP